MRQDPSLSDTALLLLFIKAPVKGQVKSRLAAVLGEDAVLELYRNFVLDILDTIGASGRPCTIFFHPPGAREAVQNRLGRERQYLPQEGNDLGERMKNAFAEVFSRGASRAVLIGSDIPDLPRGVLDEAFHALDNRDAVLGPARDGGYYLIGFRNDSFLPGVFHDVAWSTDTVFQNTLRALDRPGRTVHRLPLLRDVDTVEDLKALMLVNETTVFARSRTMAYLASNKGGIFR